MIPFARLMTDGANWAWLCVWHRAWNGWLQCKTRFPCLNEKNWELVSLRRIFGVSIQS